MDSYYVSSGPSSAGWVYGTNAAYSTSGIRWVMPSRGPDKAPQMDVMDRLVMAFEDLATAVCDAEWLLRG